MIDLEKFGREAFAPRTQDVHVPELAQWYGDDKPVWTVRGLTAAEYARCIHAAGDGRERAAALVAALSGGGDKAEAMRKLAGISEEDVPESVSRKIEFLSIGSVSPEIGSDNRDKVVLLSEAFPHVFFRLTAAIDELTGKGQEVGKRKPSGKIRESG